MSNFVVPELGVLPRRNTQFRKPVLAWEREARYLGECLLLSLCCCIFVECACVSLNAHVCVVVQLRASLQSGWPSPQRGTTTTTKHHPLTVVIVGRIVELSQCHCGRGPHPHHPTHHHQPTNHNTPTHHPLPQPPPTGLTTKTQRIQASRPCLEGLKRVPTHTGTKSEPL